MLSCLLSWMSGEWADHTYSPTLTETFIALYVNKGFQCTVGQRLESTMGAPLLNSHSRASRVQRTCWKECTQYCFKHGYLSTLILELKYKFSGRIFRVLASMFWINVVITYDESFQSDKQFFSLFRFDLKWVACGGVFFPTFGCTQFSRGFYIWDLSLEYRSSFYLPIHWSLTHDKFNTVWLAVWVFLLQWW